jgi:hypothetical protein
MCGLIKEPEAVHPRQLQLENESSQSPPEANPKSDQIV